MKKWKILNLYAGIGGNRKKWENVQVTAIEYDAEIAGVYKDFFPDDIVIVDDAHKYLEKHYKEFDFIWSSPPCQSHSKVRMMASKGGSYPPVMPDLTLYSEIIFLQHFAECLWIIENVKPYYQPLIPNTQKLGRHYIWSNFNIPHKEMSDGLSHNERGMSHKGFFDLRKYKMHQRKDQIIRNSVNPDLGQYVFDCAMQTFLEKNTKIFGD
jgi:DNA (cytosine-5)-methyltransferase 1